MIKNTEGDGVSVDKVTWVMAGLQAPSRTYEVQNRDAESLERRWEIRVEKLARR